MAKISLWTKLFGQTDFGYSDISKSVNGQSTIGQCKSDPIVFGQVLTLGNLKSLLF